MSRPILASILALLCVQACLPVPARAAAPATSFSKAFSRGVTIFNITSRMAEEGGAHVVTVAVQRSGHPFARLKLDLDYAAREAWAADLDGDRRSELVVDSLLPGDDRRGVIDVYYLEGNRLKRATLPPLPQEELSGYGGHDSFQVAQGKIVRRFLLQGRNQTELRRLTYQFHGGRLTMESSRSESAPPLPPLLPDQKSP